LVKRSRHQFAESSVTTVLPPPGQHCEQLRQPDVIFGQFKRSFKCLCIVSWAAVPCVWTL